MILPGQLHCRFGGLRAAAEEFQRGHALRSDAQQQLRQFQGRLSGTVQRWGKGESVQLFRDSVDHRPVVVADTRDEDTG